MTESHPSGHMNYNMTPTFSCLELLPARHSKQDSGGRVGQDCSEGHRPVPGLTLSQLP